MIHFIYLKRVVFPIPDFFVNWTIINTLTFAFPDHLLPSIRSKGHPVFTVTGTGLQRKLYLGVTAVVTKEDYWRKQKALISPLGIECEAFLRPTNHPLNCNTTPYNGATSLHKQLQWVYFDISNFRFGRHNAEACSSANTSWDDKRRWRKRFWGCRAEARNRKRQYISRDSGWRQSLVLRSPHTLGDKLQAHRRSES